MAKRSKSREEEELPKPELMMSREEAAKLLQDRIQKGEELLRIQVRNEAELDQLHEKKKLWHEYNAELLESMFSNRRYADEYVRQSSFGMIAIGGRDPHQELIDLRDNIQRKVTKLQSLLERLPLIKEGADAQHVEHSNAASQVANSSRKVFIVHGHDEEMKQSLARFVTKLQLDPVILHEQPNSGRTLIEKIELHAGDVGFVVVALSPDDVGASKADEDALLPRARQNVLFEWGLFIGKYGRNRVCAVYKEGVDLPSDISGVLYTQYDERGAWRFELAREIITWSGLVATPPDPGARKSRAEPLGMVSLQ